MAVNLINGNDTTIVKTNDDIQVEFSSARNQQIQQLEEDVVNLNNNNTYSTEEKVIGKWIDGKNIYQKTFSYSGTLTGKSDNLIGTIENLETLISVNGTVKYSGDNNLWFMLPRVTNTNSTNVAWSIDVKVENNNVYVVKGEYGTIEKVFVTIKYTIAS